MTRPFKMDPRVMLDRTMSYDGTHPHRDAAEARWQDPRLTQWAKDFALGILVPGAGAALSARYARDAYGEGRYGAAALNAGLAAADFVPALGILAGVARKPHMRINAGPYKDLRDRYARELNAATDYTKDHRRIKLTPERMERAKAKAASVPPLDLPEAPQFTQAREFAEAASAAGHDVRFKMPDGERGSLYVRVGDKGTVRFADHAQPKDWVDGKKVTVGGYSSSLGRRHHPATLSVDPQSGNTLEDAVKAFLREDLPPAKQKAQDVLDSSSQAAGQR